MKHVIAVLLSLVFSQAAMACSEDGSTGFLPDNNLRVSVDAKKLSTVDEREFNTVIDKIEAIYLPIAASRGGNLQIVRNWSTDTVNANATRIFGWKVNMYGGLARHPAITSDGFALVLCHEIGHQLGGAPKVSSWVGLNKWASNEGQADYFATLKCLRRAFLNDNNSAIVSKMKVPETLARGCAHSFNNSDERSLCIRNGMAGASVAALFAALRKQPEAKFETPDRKVVTKIFDDHPAHQCRLDTFFQGAICEKNLNEDVSQKDEVQGTCHGTTGFQNGLRPLCWFRPGVI
ncbi:MAG TPA: hypothetical protein VNJ01_02595 [Bacteriovoracaceae bacterium]|nr:hypothetical protein [Bacteriovoracaceae bacterium]